MSMRVKARSGSDIRETVRMKSARFAQVRTARYGVHIDGFQFVPAVHGLQSARMRHDDHPDVVYTSPCLKLGEHALMLCVSVRRCLLCVSMKR